MYVQAAIQRGDFMLLVKPWYRIPEPADSDDNPRIADFIGRAELQGIWYRGDHTVGLTVRTNLRDTRGGSALVEWAFPLFAKFRGYVQLFSGYGESLIDYNHRQTAAGFGVMLGDGI